MKISLLCLTLTVFSGCGNPSRESKPSGIEMQLFLLEDPSSTLNFNEVQKKDRDFVAMPGNIMLVRGFSPESLWLKITVFNTLDSYQNANLVFNNGRVSYMETYAKSDTGEWQETRQGYIFRKPILDWDYLYPVQVTIPAQSQKTVYIHLKGNYYKRTVMHLVRESDYAGFLNTRWVILIVYAVICAFLFLLSFNNYMIFGNSSYMHYSLYVLAVWIITMLQWGQFAPLLPEAEIWMEKSFSWLALYASIQLFVFINSFLQLKNFSIRMDRILVAIPPVFIALFLGFVFLSSADTTFEAYNALSLFFTWIYVIAIIFAAFRGHQFSKLALFAMIPAVTFISIQHGQLLKIIPFSSLGASASLFAFPLHLIAIFVIQKIRLKNIFKYYNISQAPAAPAGILQLLKKQDAAQDGLNDETIHRNKIKKTYLKPEEIDTLIAKLKKTMEEENLWQVEDIRAPQLAAALGIPGHHLQELLNGHLGTSFNSLVKEYRIQEAIRILKENPETKILDLGLETGFQSRSNFNSAFKEITGVTPQEFRSSLLQEAAKNTSTQKSG